MFFNFVFLFVCVVCIVLCYLCLHVVLFLLWATWLLSQHDNKQELNGTDLLNYVCAKFVEYNVNLCTVTMFFSSVYFVSTEFHIPRSNVSLALSMKPTS